MSPSIQDLWLEDCRDSRCPKCGLKDLIAGPWGGASRNVYCPHCLRGWNLHGVRYGIVSVENLGEVSEDQIAFAVAQYPNEQPWRLKPLETPGIARNGH